MNPRDKRAGGERRSLGPTRPGGAVWYILGLLFLLALAQAWFMAPAGRQVSYSEFKQAVRSGQVAEVFVGDQTIRGTYKRETNDGRSFNTTRIEDPKLIEDLDAASVKYTGEMVSRWLPEVLGWVVPLLLLFGVWSFFFRRMSGAEGGVIFGRRRRCEHHLDAGGLGFEGRDQLVLPDGEVVAAPAFDVEGNVSGVSQPGGAENAGAEKQCRQ